MTNENSIVDLEAGNPPPQESADETIFDIEHCSDLDEEKRTSPGGLIACSIFTCTVLSIIAVLVWAVVTSIPKADSEGSVEPAAAAMYNVTTNISDSTPNMVAGGIGNNSATNSMLSFAGTRRGRREGVDAEEQEEEGEQVE
ncbi:uncharacterized protein N7473_011916 [Penicillium subrubescens]|uniref:uncharacterized protein n=1 Tax=Penicillium subrubescens TaxID=1316194 RepID=UPI002544D5A5|nr:uncharacterized protein N7473_011916 [Penicillium subrubescens]KAJ5880863.1 hypothetical protein N7473_011916 [Penicillium subrubescens]